MPDVIPRGLPTPMPNGPDQRANRNRRPRRRSQSTNRLPVTEQDEVAELEAARERNDLDIRDLGEMSVKELQQVGAKLEIEGAARREELVDQILQAQTERSGLEYAFGILDVVDDGYGFMRRHGLLPSADDVYVSSSQVRRFGLRIGDRVTGAVRAPREGEKFYGLIRVDSVNGVDTDTARRRPHFGDLTPIHPIELINLESDPKNLSQRLVNLVNPLGKGQRGLIVSPPKAGKTTMLKHIANGISANYPDILPHGRAHRRAPRGSHGHAPLRRRRGHQLHLRRADREPHARRGDGARDREAPGRDRPGRRDPARLDHAAGARLQPGRSRRAAARSRAVSTRVALYPPKRFFGARAEDRGGRVAHDHRHLPRGHRLAHGRRHLRGVQGHRQLELILDRKLAEKRIFPAIDVQRSGTRREELLLEEGTLKMVWTMRRMLSAVGTNEGIELLLNRIAKTESNAQFLGTLTKSLDT